MSATTPKSNQFSLKSFFQSNKELIPSFLGWIFFLLLIDTVCFSSSLFHFYPSDGKLIIFLARVVFFLAICFGVFLGMRFKRKHIILLCLCSMILSFCSFLSNDGLFNDIFSYLALFSLGVIGGLFGLDFFLSFSNHVKFVSLCLGFVFSVFLYLFASWEYFFETISFLVIMFAFFKQKLPVNEKTELAFVYPERWLLALALLSYAVNGIISLSLSRFLSSKGDWNIFLLCVGSISGVILAYLFLKSRYVDFTFALYTSFAFSSLAGLGLFLIPHYPFLLYLTSFFSSLSHALGLLSLYYVVGVYTKKYKDFHFYYSGVIISAVTYASFIAVDIFYPPFEENHLLIWGSVILLLSLLVFILTPLLFNKKEWISDLKRSDVTYKAPIDSFFDDYHLSKREKEVAIYLLSGLTLKQISFEMSLSYPTINTYLTSLYRKLNINSRVELVLLCRGYLAEKTRE
ncbi:MAG: LuxR family transcriptional regulator [Bacilli bacterium]|jgi:DNA-binding CsgD family transcriptional regulator|nr:LuxR family transcriptional regulator [Bacilli bacterium]